MKDEQSIVKNMQKIGYSGLALYEISDGSVNYIVIAVNQSQALDNLREHFKDIGMLSELDYYGEMEMYPANKAVNIRYPDHDLEVTLKAKEWAAIFDTNRPEWGVIACNEWN